MFSCVKDYNYLIEWMISNLIWVIVAFLLVRIFLSFRAIKISKLLLKQNRPTRDSQRGKHLADRFIDVWHSKNGINASDKNYALFGNNSCWSLNVIDKKLKEKQLVYIENGITYPITKFENKIIIKILKFYLIHFTRDGKECYINMEKKK